MLDVIEQFRSAMLDAGITPPAQIYVDGKKHRFSTSGHAKDTSGEYRIYPDYIPAGYFLDWRTGAYSTWCQNIGRPYTLEETFEHKKAIEKNKKQEQDEQDVASRKAQQIWDNAPIANSDHPYLVAKGIPSVGIRTYKDNLIVPVTLDKKIYSLQFITPNGQKFFMSNGRVSGCYFSIGKSDSIFCICEGPATGISIHQATGHAVVVAFSCGNLSHVAQHIRNKFPEASILFCADDDKPGLKAAQQASVLVSGKIATPRFDNSRTEKDTDFNDMALRHGIDSVKMVIDSELSTVEILSNELAKCVSVPLQLPNPLPPVMPFDPNMLPDAIRDFVMDVSKRQQSAPDYVAVTAICGFAAILGRKILMRPKQNDDWTVTPNQWGAIIGRPSAMKSPCMKEALKPIYTLEAHFSDLYAQEKKAYEIESELINLQNQSNKSAAKEKLRDGDHNAAVKELQKSCLVTPPPTRQRLIVNDSSVEKLGELLNENSNGLLLVRDELNGWLSKLQKEEFQADRSFYLECFDGNGRYTCDRIGRGTVEITNCTLSIIGGIQPSKIASLIRRAISGEADDGLVQRLQLSVWPDECSNWQWQDHIPSAEAYDKYNKALLSLHNLYVQDAVVPTHLHFTNDAQSLFVEWMKEIQQEARSEDIHPVLESHLLKMPQTIAGLALLFEVVNGGRLDVGVECTAMALEWADYLKSHAKRLYSLGLNLGIEGAHLLLKRKKKLIAPFTAREIYRKGWKGINSVQDATEAIQCLIDHRYLEVKTSDTQDAGGRPTVVYQWIQY